MYLAKTKPLGDERLKEIERETDAAQKNSPAGIMRSQTNLLLAEIKRLRAGEDTKLLDWLERRRLALNRHYGTDYGWEFVSNHNVNRVFVRSVGALDVNDAKAHGPDIRTVLRAAIAAEGE